MDARPFGNETHIEDADAGSKRGTFGTDQHPLWGGDVARHQGLNYKTDPRHIEFILEKLRLTEAKFAATPGIQEKEEPMTTMKQHPGTKKLRTTKFSSQDATIHRQIDLIYLLRPKEWQEPRPNPQIVT